MEEIYGLRGLRRHDIQTKFHKDWFWDSEVVMERYTYRQQDDYISLLSFFQNKVVV
jgi:hypothetical protein